MQYRSHRVCVARLLATALFVVAAHSIMPAHGQSAANPDRTIGQQPDGSYVVSSGQTITPAGTIVQLGASVRVKAVAVNPKNNTASALLMGASEAVVVLNTATGAVLQRFASPSSKGSFNGIAYSADGTKLFFSQDDNHFVTADVDAATGVLSLASSLTLPPPPPGSPYPYWPNPSLINPGGIAISPDGTHAYVTLNAANTLGVVDLTTATLQAQVAVENAPNTVVVSADGHYAYVSNEGGRLARHGEYTNAADGAAIVADPKNAFAITGTVSVVDLTINKQVASIDVGLHPAGMTISGRHLYVTNSYSDTVSVVDLHTNKVVRTIDLRAPIPGHDQDNAHDRRDGAVVDAAASLRAFGSGPNAITVVEESTAYVTLGTSNAIAVIDLSNPFFSPVIGYIPTGYFPPSIAYDAANKQLVVADDKGIGTNPWPGNSTQALGAVNLIPLPNAQQLAEYTKQVIDNNQWSSLNPNIFVGAEFVDHFAQPLPVPKHIGEPSTIKHVFLIVKENNTYAAMLGDLSQDDSRYIAYFASSTPNHHELVKRFPLLDNTYAPARQSNDGHQWIAASGAFYSNEILSPDWVPRGAQYYSTDALTYTPRGFLWSAAKKKGLSVKLYGEYARVSTPVINPANGQPYVWGDFYNTAMCVEGKIAASTCATLTQVPFTADNEASNVPSAQEIIDPHYPSFNLTIPDQYRVDYWLPIFEHQVKTNTVPDLTIMWLPDDHGNATTAGYPTVSGMIADNDLALGRVVEAISNSKVWKDTAIFVEEDDTANDADIFNGRMPAFVISPWTAPPQAAGHGQVIHTLYTQENINRTIEQILGFEPLTQFDLVASPMWDAFGSVPDFTPYVHVPETVPLNQQPNGTYLGWTGLGQSFGELELAPLQKAWIEASNEMTKDKTTTPDAIDPDFMRHVNWYSATNWTRPFPGESEIRHPDSFAKAAAKKSLDGGADGDDDDRPLQ